METVTAVNAYQEYQVTCRFLAHKFGPYGSGLDMSARSREDYMQELRLHAVSVANVFQSRFGFSQEAEKRYTNRSLFHKALSWQASEKNERVKVEIFKSAAIMCDVGAYEMAALEIKHDVSRILARFSLGDREVLARVAESGGSVRDAWNSEVDGSWEVFRAKVTRLRKRARKLWAEVK